MLLNSGDIFLEHNCEKFQDLISNSFLNASLQIVYSI